MLLCISLPGSQERRKPALVDLEIKFELAMRQPRHLVFPARLRVHAKSDICVAAIASTLHCTLQSLRALVVRKGSIFQNLLSKRTIPGNQSLKPSFCSCSHSSRAYAQCALFSRQPPHVHFQTCFFEILGNDLPPSWKIIVGWSERIADEGSIM